MWFKKKIKHQWDDGETFYDFPVVYNHYNENDPKLVIHMKGRKCLKCGRIVPADTFKWLEKDYDKKKKCVEDM